MKQVDYTTNDFKQFLNDFTNTKDFNSWLDYWFPKEMTK